MADDFKETAEGLERVTKASGPAKEGITAYGMALVEAIKNSTATKAVLSELSETFGSLQKMSKYVSTSLDKIGIKDVGMATVSAIGAMTKMLPEASKAFGDLGKAGGMAGRDMTESLKGMQPWLEKMPGGKAFMAFAGPMAESASAGINLQKSLIGLYAASGNLNKLLTDSGGKFKDLNVVSAAYADSLYRVTSATGASSAQVNSLIQGLQNIPGILDEQNIQARAASNSMSNMVAILRVQAATGMSTAAMTENLNFAYETLNLKGQGALEVLAQMSEVSKDSGLPLQAVSKYVQDTGHAFKFFGDNTQTAMASLSRLLPGLKDAKIGYGAIREILSNVTASMADLNVGQRAFISGQSGGPGGLQGSFKMLHDLSTNKGADVFKQMETAFKRNLGGPMVTLQEASQSQGAAAQFQKQLSMLQAMGMKGDEKMLAKISDAFAKPETLTGVDKEAALKNALGRGEDFQERTATGMDLANSYLERMSMLMAIQNSITARTFLGTEGGKGPMADMVKKGMEESAKLAATVGVTAQGKKQTDINALMDEAKGFLNEGISKTFAGYDAEKAKEEADKKLPAGTKKSESENPIFNPVDFIKKFMGGGNIPTLQEASQSKAAEAKFMEAAYTGAAIGLGTPDQVAKMLSSPPTTNAGLAPAPGSKESAFDKKVEEEKQLGVLKIEIDTSFYENNMKKIAHKEVNVALKNGDEGTIIHVRPDV